jgi:hypothetical protein
MSPRESNSDDRYCRNTQTGITAPSHVAVEKRLSRFRNPPESCMLGVIVKCCWKPSPGMRVFPCWRRSVGGSWSAEAKEDILLVTFDHSSTAIRSIIRSNKNRCISVQSFYCQYPYIFPWSNKFSKHELAKDKDDIYKLIRGKSRIICRRSESEET